MRFFLLLEKKYNPSDNADMSNDKGKPIGWPRLKLMVLIKVTASKFINLKD